MNPLFEMLGRMLSQQGYTTDEWATILNVNARYVILWIEGRDFPTPETLRRIVRTLEEDPGVPRSFIAEFQALAAQPLREVSPKGGPISETLDHYMMRPVWEAFERTMHTLPPYLQEQVLLEAAALVRAKRSLPREKPVLDPAEDLDHQLRVALR
jgi:hypothetical protein